jgi:hypothetical protein
MQDVLQDLFKDLLQNPLPQTGFPRCDRLWINHRKWGEQAAKCLKIGAVAKWHQMSGKSRYLRSESRVGVRLLCTGLSIHGSCDFLLSRIGIGNALRHDAGLNCRTLVAEPPMLSPTEASTSPIAATTWRVAATT